MSNLTTRKIVLGMLMTLVLAFSVQGIADALTFRESRTGDLPTVVVDNEFTISFSVPPGSNTTRITDANGKLIKDSTTTGGAENVRIDSSGYLVSDIGTREYRTIPSPPSGSLVVDPRPTYSDDDPSSAGTASTPYYVDSSRNVVDSAGDAVYVQTGGGDRDGADPWRYTRAKANPNEKVDDLNRYHYNEESISILAPAGVDLRRVGSHAVNVAGGTAHTMDEMKNSVNDKKLSSTIRLTYYTNTAGKYAITITDTTPASDRPGTEAPPLRFTIFVVPSYDGTTDLSLEGAGVDGYETRNDNADPSINILFGDGDAFEGSDNVPLVYSVEGSGRLYVKETYSGGSPTSQSRPTQTLPTSSQANVYLDMNGSSNKVTAYVRDRNAAETGKTIIFIFNYAAIEIISGDNKTGVPNSRLIDPLVIRVKDAKGRALSGLAVSFTPASGATLQPILGTNVYLTDMNIWASTFDTIARTRQATSTVPPAISADAISPAAWVPTDRSGEAAVYLKLGTEDDKDVTVNVFAGGGTARFYATSSTSTDIPSLEILSGNNQRSATNGKVADPLVVRVLASDNQPLPTQTVTFTTTKGYLRTTPGYELGADPVNGPATQVKAKTDVNGKASVGYDLVNHEGAADVIAEISSADIPVYQRRVTFNVNGRATPSRAPADDDDDEGDAPITSSVTIDVPSTVTGTAGGTATLIITASATATVTAGGLNDNFPLPNIGSFTRSGTTHTSTLTLPNQVTSYSLTVFVRTAAGITTLHSVTVSTTAAAAQTGGTLTVRIDPFSGAPGTTATVTVTAADASVQPANVTVNLTATGGTLSSSSVATGTTGTTTVTLTRGSTAGTENFVTVSGPSGYTSVNGRFIIAGPVGRDTTVGAAENLDDYDGNNQMGSLNSRLAEPFIVEVVDANDNPVEDARVRFRTTIGSGRFSPRAFSRTDEDGLAEITFTPTSTGRIRVVATVAGADSTAAFIVQGGEPADALVKVSGDTQSGTPGNALANPFVVEVQDEDGEPLAGHRVTFSVTAGGGSLSETSAAADEDGRAETTLTLGSERGVNSVQASVSGVDPVTFNTNIEPKILVAVANRPVMYWIDSGMLSGLTGAKAAKIAESANDVAVGGGKVYWTEQTGESGGTVNSANLDGTDVTELASIFATPIGIAVDAAGSKLYWTNASGRIQSANLDGSGIKNVMQNLSDPTDIVVSNGFIYWTEGGNSVRRVNISGQKIAIDVAVNLDSVGGLAVGGGKVYWTEMTSASAGTVNGSNLNGTNFETLATLLSAPMGISVDTAGSKLYWTNARGRVQSANLNGSMIKNVVEGLISPSKLAIGGANTAVATIKATTPAKKDNAKYDVNGDGAVDNTDASLVAAAMNTSNAKYDVNGDGTVNFLDLLLVFDNREDAAAAPTIVGMKLTAIQIDIIQEQINLLIATNDRSPSALRVLIYLQQLIVTARPEKTQLFANYPNPFNPETWIPYELATDTDVRLTIYNTQGVVIRTMPLGHQSAGYYTGRDRAAYWDGRNALGEQVASGLYFYQLETDEMSSMRKMVILK